MCDASASASALAGPVQPALRASRVEVDVSKFLCGPLRNAPAASWAGGETGCRRKRAPSSLSAIGLEGEQAYEYGSCSAACERVL